MATTVEKLVLELTAENKQALNRLGQLEKKIGTTEKKTNGFMKSMKLGWVAIAGLMVGVSVGLKKALNLASEFQETNSKFKVVFKGVEKEAKILEKELTSAYGMSRLEAEKFLSSAQDLLVPLGLNRLEASKLSGEMVKLATDIGSFNDLPTADVLRDVQSAMVGNSETVRKYGVVLNESVLKEKAMAEGIELVNGKLDPQSKALLTLKLITQGTADAQGDFIRTQDGWANQTKILKSNLTDLAVTIGSKLMSALTPLILNINDLFDANQNIDDVTTTLIATQTEYKRVMNDLGGSIENATQKQTQALLQLRIEAINSMRSLNAMWDLQNLEGKKGEHIVQRLTTAQKNNQEVIDRNTESVKRALKSKEKWVEIEIQSVEGMKETTIEYFRIGKAQAIYGASIDANIQSVQSLANRQEEMDNIVGRLAKSLYNNVFAEEDLLTLAPSLQEAIKKRMVTIEEEILLEERLEKQKKARFESEQKAIDKQKFLDELFDYVNTQKEIELKMAEEKYLALKEQSIKHKEGMLEIDAEYEERKKEIEDKYREDKINKDNEMLDEFSGMIESAFGGFVDGLLDVTLESKKFKDNFGEYMKGVVIELGKAIAKMLIMKGIMALINVATGGVGGTVASLFKGVTGFEHGGKVKPVYASDGFFAPKGTDTIPAMLTPNERVLTVKQNSLFEGLLSSLAHSKNNDLHFATGGIVPDAPGVGTNKIEQTIIVQGNVIDELSFKQFTKDVMNKTQEILDTGESI